MKFKIAGLLVFASLFVVVGNASEETNPVASPSPAISPAPVAAVSKKKDSCPSEEGLISELQKKREELDVRVKEIETKESELKAKERALEVELKKLEAVRDEITKTRELSSKDNEEKVNKLVEAFETMSPKAGAQLLGSVDEALAVAAMSKMSTAKLAKVLNVMDSVRSTRLTELMAGLARAKVIVSNDTTRVRNESAKGGEKDDGHINNKHENPAENSASKAGGTVSEEGKKPR